MTTTTTTSTSTPPAAPATPGPGVLRRHRAGLVVSAGLVLLVLAVAALSGGPRTGTPLDPDNPGSDGAQALARVLSDRGVEVVVARDADELAGAGVGPGTTVLVSRPDDLGASTADGLLELAEDARLVVAGAGAGAARLLGVRADGSRVRVGAGREADCDDPGLAPVLDGLRIEVDGARAHRLPGCFGGEGGSLVSVPRAGLVLLGADEALTNDQVLRADNAAVALRLLGREDRLVWYVPSLADLGAEDGVSLRSLAPPWTGPALFLLLLVVLALALWRGRRLGPLATEPLPVVVRAVETTRSRGRLYHRSGDRGHAARVLRRATARRLATHLRLAPGAPPPVLAAAAADRAGRPAAEVAALLDPHAPPPGTDRDLVTLATQLSALEEEVRHP